MPIFKVWDGSTFVEIPGGGDTHPVVQSTDLVKGAGDSTKLARVDVDTNVPTGTVVVVKWPSADLDLETVLVLAPVSARYIVEEAHGTLSSEFSLGSLATGLLLNTVAAGVGVLTKAVGSDLPLHTHNADALQISQYNILSRTAAGFGNAKGIDLNGTLEISGGDLQRAALTGDVTAAAGSNATTIAADAVTYAKMQDVSATDKVLGRETAGAGAVEEIACTAAGRALLDDANAAAQRTTLGLGAIATEATPLAIAKGGSNADLSGGALDGKLIRMNAGGTALESSGKSVPTGDIVGTTDAQTLSGKSIAASQLTGTIAGARLAAKHKTHTKAIQVPSPEAAEEYVFAFIPDAVTITQVITKCSAGTVDFNIQHRSETTPGTISATKLFAADQEITVAQADYPDDQAFEDATVAANSCLAVVFASPASIGTVWILVSYTIDD